ncbi:MAG: DUF2442 domain-containing protein [Methylococcales bacterium]|jgi:Protein of unknown function (DUF2442)|nr:DUF2442 domain-containing protein [Methylococcales bacterium]
MTTLNFKPLAKTIKFDDSMMWVELSDGRTLGTPLVYFPRLLNASKQQRECYEISGGGIGLHWEELDEDIHVGYLLMGGFDVSQNSVSNKNAEHFVS